MATQWSLDYCLTCDRQTSGEAYCSQNCRLADLESSSVSSSSASSCPTSPTYPFSFLPAIHDASTRDTAAATRASSSTPSASKGFYLPPAFDFASYRQSRQPTSTRPIPVGSFGRNTVSMRPLSINLPIITPTSPPAVRSSHGRAISSPRLLSPSSSQVSLSSIYSYGITESVSRQAKDELREYTNSFDQVRDLKRRMTSS
jgi:hypothetical protein